MQRLFLDLRSMLWRPGWGQARYICGEQPPSGFRGIARRLELCLKLTGGTTAVDCDYHQPPVGCPCNTVPRSCYCIATLTATGGLSGNAKWKFPVVNLWQVVRNQRAEVRSMQLQCWKFHCFVPLPWRAHAMWRQRLLPATWAKCLGDLSDNLWFCLWQTCSLWEETRSTMIKHVVGCENVVSACFSTLKPWVSSWAQWLSGSIISCCFVLLRIGVAKGSLQSFSCLQGETLEQLFKKSPVVEEHFSAFQHQCVCQEWVPWSETRWSRMLQKQLLKKASPLHFDSR